LLELKNAFRYINRQGTSKVRIDNLGSAPTKANSVYLRESHASAGTQAWLD